MAVSILLFISAVIDGDRTVLASFKILGPIPSRPVAFCRIQSVYKFSNLIDCYFRYAKENVNWYFRADMGFQLSQIRCTSNNIIGIDVFSDRGKIII